MFIVSERWKLTHPDAMAAMLVVKEAINSSGHPELECRKRMLETELRVRFQNPDDIKDADAIRAYTAYYRKFEKTYHLVQQLKTLVMKQRPLPVVSGLVDAMFMAEMKNLLLTAGHDLATVTSPVTLDAAVGTEEYTKLNQEPQLAKSGDMMVTDKAGILSTVIHGPDYRSRITPQTRDVLYVVYAPQGISRDDVCLHLRDIGQSILVFSPAAHLEPMRLLSAAGIEEVGW